MLEQLEIYINAQKTIGNYMVAFGLILFLLAVVFHFGGSNSLFFGLKVGLLIRGLFSTVSGFGYKMVEDKLLKTQAALYHINPSEFHNLEKERMQKVVKNHLRIQIILVAICSIELIIGLVLKNELVSGLLYSLAILSIGNLIIDRVSKTSIDRYFEQLMTN